MPRTQPIYDLKPVSEVPPLIQQGRKSKFSSMLDEVQKQPGQNFELATYQNRNGASNVKSSLKAQYGDKGFTFEARRVDATERGGPAGETWSVLYARYG